MLDGKANKFERDFGFFMVLRLLNAQVAFQAQLVLAGFIGISAYLQYHIQIYQGESALELFETLSSLNLFNKITLLIFSSYSGPFVAGTILYGILT